MLASAANLMVEVDALVVSTVLIEIGRELGVDYLLEGSVRTDGSRVRITAQLIEVRGETHLWAET